MDEHVDGNIAFQMGRIIFRLDQDLRQDILRPLDVSYTHFRILQFLYARRCQTIGAISKEIVMQHSVVSRVVDQMEKRKLVERRRRPDDARLVDIILTPKGRSTYEVIWPRARALLEHAFSNVTSRDQAKLLRVLHVVNQTINE